MFSEIYNFSFSPDGTVTCQEYTLYDRMKSFFSKANLIAVNQKSMMTFTTGSNFNIGPYGNLNKYFFLGNYKLDWTQIVN